ncbi:hypothetical protein HK097_010405, partial [Rhizophlyctis rosea]
MLARHRPLWVAKKPLCQNLPAALPFLDHVRLPEAFLKDGADVPEASSLEIAQPLHSADCALLVKLEEAQRPKQLDSKKPKRSKKDTAAGNPVPLVPEAIDGDKGVGAYSGNDDDVNAGGNEKDKDKKSNKVDENEPEVETQSAVQGEKLITKKLQVRTKVHVVGVPVFSS